MHYHLEVIMPPTEDIEGALEQILKEYNENYENEEEGEEPYKNKYAFYDWYVIGGRWSGSKLESILGSKNIKKFRELLSKEKITVGSFVAGKESLKPSSQIGKVNKLWNDFFPKSPVKECPFFDNYKDDYGDVLELSKLPDDLIASHVIIAKYHWQDKKKLEVEFMLQQEIWNGSTHQETAWKGNVRTAIKQYKKQIKNYASDFKKESTPKEDWICVTVDYHS